VNPEEDGKPLQETAGYKEVEQQMSLREQPADPGDRTRLTNELAVQANELLQNKDLRRAPEYNAFIRQHDRERQLHQVNKRLQKSLEPNQLNNANEREAFQELEEWLQS